MIDILGDQVSIYMRWHELPVFKDGQPQFESEMYLLPEVYADKVFIGFIKDDRLCADASWLTQEGVEILANSGVWLRAS